MSHVRVTVGRAQSRVLVLVIVIVIVIGRPGESMQFDHEKLVVYQVSIEFVAWAGVLLDGPLAGVRLSAVGQLDRASTSVPLNLASKLTQTFSGGLDEEPGQVGAKRGGGSRPAWRDQ
jgi:hypothetical protein